MNTRPGVTYNCTRMLRIARRVFEGGEVTAKWIMGEFGVSWATAKRDMQLVGMYLPVEIVKPTRWPGRDPREKRIRLVERRA